MTTKTKNPVSSLISNTQQTIKNQLGIGTDPPRIASLGSGSGKVSSSIGSGIMPTGTAITPDTIGKPLTKEEMLKLQEGIKSGGRMSQALDMGKQLSGVDPQTLPQQPIQTQETEQTKEPFVYSGEPNRFYLGEREVSREDYERTKLLMDMKREGATFDQRAFDFLADMGIPEYAQQRQMQQLAQIIGQQNAQELKNIGYEDFTELNEMDKNWKHKALDKWDSLDTAQKAAVLVIAGGAIVATGGAAGLAGLKAGTALGIIGGTGKVATAGKVAGFFTAKNAFWGVVGTGYVLKEAGNFVLNLNEQKAKAIQREMNDITSESTQLVRSISRGVDPNAVEEILMELEQEMRTALIRYNQAKAYNLKERYLGIDIQTTARKDMRKITSSLQIVREYKMTGDLEKLQREIGGFDFDE
jgi:hypothetical protein